MDDKLQKGQILKQAREAKGISLESVHEATKIPLDALKAIEEGYTIRSMTPFYYRGFLKIYTRYLGMDPGQVVENVRKDKDKESNVPSYFAGKKTDILVPKRTIPEISPEVKMWGIRILVGLIALFIIVKAGQAIGQHWKNRVVKPDNKIAKTKDAKNPLKAKLPSKTEKPKEAAPAVIKEPVVVPQEEPRKEEVKREEPKDQDVRKTIDLAVRAKKDSWLQVKIDGAVVFRSTLKKGTVETWHANKNMEISGKDIGELEFELNGKIIGPLSKENRRAKKILINQNGFSVK